MRNRLRLFLRKASYGRGVILALTEIDRDGNVCAVAGPAIFQKVEPNEFVSNDEFATISMESAQNLMDELWFLGFRPEHGDVANSTAAAAKAHLQDMRAIAFHKLEINQP